MRKRFEKRKSWYIFADSKKGLFFILTRGGGGFSTKVWVGVCRPGCQTLTLFMTKNFHLPYPVDDMYLRKKVFIWAFDSRKWSVFQHWYHFVGHKVGWQPGLQKLSGKIIPCDWRAPMYPVYDSIESKTHSPVYESRSKTHTLFSDTSPYRPYMMGVSSPQPPWTSVDKTAYEEKSTDSIDNILFITMTTAQLPYCIVCFIVCINV